uniref:Catsper channel auxiliary subunit zeta n=1 Tax=Canis lupus familiaris TaxID=9615 RepID=A0A8I3PT12_CANLF
MLIQELNSYQSRSSYKDTRNLWTRATLSQPKLNVPRSKICDDSDAEGSSLGSKTRRGYSRKAGREPGDLHGHLSLEMELRRGSILGSHLEEDVDSKTETEVSSSESWLSMSRHTPHGAYWIEQQNRLPLPLMEVVENEALEILTKALWSEDGPDHFLTKHLQRYIEGLKRRRSKRLHLVMY